MSSHNNGLVSMVSFVTSVFVISLITLQLEAEGRPAHSMTRMKNIRSVQSNLEDIVANKTNVEDLRVRLISKASYYYEQLNQAEKDGLRASPDLRLVIDIVLAPIKKLLQMNLGEEVVKKAISDKYKLLKPAYMSGKQIGGSTHILKKPRSATLKDKFFGFNQEPFKYEDFVAGKKEALGFLRRMDELCKEALIYTESGSQEFISYVDFFNNQDYKALFIHVYPSMRTHKKLSVLKSKYEEKMKLFGWRNIEGDWIMSGHFSEEQEKELAQAGFMFVDNTLSADSFQSN